jgi:hypothetical protein
MKIDLRKIPAVYMNLKQHTEKSEQMQTLLMNVVLKLELKLRVIIDQKILQQDVLVLITMVYAKLILHLFYLRMITFYITLNQ